MSTWAVFLNYAKENPEKIPKDAKQRSKIYHDFIVLRAKVKALEDILQDKDVYIAELEKFLSSFYLNVFEHR